MHHYLWKAALIMAATTAAAAETNPDVIPDDAYVTVSPDGHLQRGGERVRFWGFIGHVTHSAKVEDGDSADVRKKKIEKMHADMRLMAERVDDLGFNLVRCWDRIQPREDFNDYEPGDGSTADSIACYYNELAKRGITLWMSPLNNVGTVTPDDASIIDDPATSEAWRAAVAELVKKNKNRPVGLRCGHGGFPAHVRIWDPRFEALGIERMRRIADFRNKYKGGLRLADDPQVVVWELSNEEIWYKGMFNGAWQRLPAFFRNQLLGKWNAFLWDKYGTEEKLMKRWQFLLPGESLYQGTIMLAPLARPASAELAVNDSNPQAIESLKMVKQKYTRDDFTRARGEDVVEFFTRLWIDHKQREMDALKTWGKSCRRSPCLWDAGNCYQIQASYFFQHSEATATCAYIKGMAHDPTYKRWPFHSGLEAPPRICWDVPWFEQSSVTGKPHFVYETQIDNRTKYRAEYPMRVAALGAIQDWDIVCWHIYGHCNDSSKESPFESPIHIWHDYLGYGGDEVQLSAMRAASEIFKDSLVEPAPEPTTFVFGRRSLYDPRSMDYGRSYGDLGKKIIPTAWRYGLRVHVDPTREDDAIAGPHYTQGVYEPNPVKPNDQIELDWQRGHLKFDAPGVKSYTGFYGQHGGPVTFSDGTMFRDVRFDNPPGIAYPVTPEEGYVSITVASTDGEALARTNRAVVSCVSTSFNTGYELDLTRSSRGMRQQGPENVPPREFWGAWPSKPGTTPVLVVRVGATVECRDLDGMRYTMRDWHMRSVGEGVVENGTLHVPADKPVFLIDLER